MSALMALMRKLWTVAYRVLKSGSRYNATKVWVGHPAAADDNVSGGSGCGLTNRIASLPRRTNHFMPEPAHLYSAWYN
jgi:hypothetical protein